MPHTDYCGTLGEGITALNDFANGLLVTNGGSGYTAAPVISFIGGGGSGATATAFISTNVSIGVYPTL